MSERPHILSMSPDELATWLQGVGEPGYRLRQVADWIYKHKAPSFDAMMNLPASLRTKLSESLDFAGFEIASQLKGQDGSTKLLFKSERGYVESVILRYENRTSLCVSSQVGCRLACSFCQTGKLGFV